MSENSNFNNGNVQVTFPWISLLGIAFIILKLCKVIAWSGLWVLSPFWISAAIAILVIRFMVIVYVYASK